MLVKDTLRYFFTFPCLIVSEFSQLCNVGHFPLTFLWIRTMFGDINFRTPNGSSYFGANFAAKLSTPLDS